MSYTHCLYHGNCADGAAAAAVVVMRHPDVELIPCHYGDPVPELPSDAKVIMVDFSYKRHVMEELRSRVGSLFVIDHHDTAEKELEGLPYAFFDQSESGATLTWQLLVPGKEVPELLQYIKDRDIWKWELPESRAFSYGWRASGAWDDPKEIARILGTGVSYQSVDAALESGRVLVDFIDDTIAKQIENPMTLTIGGHEVPAVNCTTLVSEVGEALQGDAPFAATFWVNSEGRFVFSLRENGGSGVHVGEIAASYGGGGHPKAAGFRVDSLGDL